MKNGDNESLILFLLKIMMFDGIVYDNYFYINIWNLFLIIIHHIDIFLLILLLVYDYTCVNSTI